VQLSYSNGSIGAAQSRWCETQAMILKNRKIFSITHCYPSMIVLTGIAERRGETGEENEFTAVRCKIQLF
jgi:hypothetical protein